MTSKASRSVSLPVSARRLKSFLDLNWAACLPHAIHMAALVARPPPKLTVSEWASYCFIGFDDVPRSARTVPAWWQPPSRGYR